MKSRQQGLTLISAALVGVFLVGVVLLGFKATPAYTEYSGVKRIIGQVADEGSGGASESEMRRSFERRADIEQSITTVKPTDLVIRREGGRTVITVEWEKKVPLFSNVSLAFDFEADTSKNQHR
jgi:hypothetical protein